MTKEEAIKVLSHIIKSYKTFPKMLSKIPHAEERKNEYVDALKVAIEALSADAVQEWIPCSERLPEVGQDILMSVGGMYTAEGCLREDGDWAQFRWDAIQRKDMVDAWMSLPEPYKGGEDG